MKKTDAYLLTCLSLTRVFCVWVWLLLNLQKSKYTFPAVKKSIPTMASLLWKRVEAMNLRHLCPKQSIYGS